MSVASVAELLQAQGGGGGGGDGDFTDIVIGPLGSQVILECDVEDQLLINDNTTATIEWVALNFPLDSEIGNYSTITETTDYLDTNYTNNTDLNTNFVSNATIANYSTTTETTDYLDTNYTKSVDLANDYVAVGGLADYTNKTDTNQYLTDNYTNNTDLNTDFVSNTTLDSYSTTTETTDYITALYTNTTDLNKDYTTNTNLTTNYYTTAQYTSNFLSINNYFTQSRIVSKTFQGSSVSLNPDQFATFDILLENWFGSPNSSYIAVFKTPVSFYTITCRYNLVETTGTLVNVNYQNITSGTVSSKNCFCTILAMN